MNSFFIICYSIISFTILISLTFYVIKQISNTQELEGNIKKLQVSLKQRPSSYADLYKLGQLYLRKKLFNKALLVFREALTIWDKNDKIGVGTLSNTIGFTYFKLKKYQFAIYYYRVAITILPDYLLALKNLAFIYESINSFENASQCYKKCLVLNPTNNFFATRLQLIQRQIDLQPFIS